MDQRQREFERDASSGDVEAAAAVLRERIRSGELTQEHVELAASLGHEAARLVCPEVEPAAYLIRSDNPRKSFAEEPPWVSAVQLAYGLLGARTLAQVAVDWAQRVLPLWESAYPNKEPREAIDAARAWIDCPCEEHRSLAHEIRETTMSIGHETRCWGMGKMVYLAGDAPYEAAHAAAAAACVDPKHHAGYTAADAAEEAAWHAFRAHTHVAKANQPLQNSVDQEDPEREWQRLRLAAYVLGEV